MAKNKIAYYIMDNEGKEQLSGPHDSAKVALQEAKTELGPDQVYLLVKKQTVLKFEIFYPECEIKEIK